jgi:hypothetical protein
MGPKSIYFQTLHGDTTRPAQQSVENFDRAIAVAKNGVNFGHPSRTSGPPKASLLSGSSSVALRSASAASFLEIGENFAAEHVCLPHPGFASVVLRGGFCFQKGGSRADFVLKRLRAKPMRQYLPPRPVNRREQIVRKLSASCNPSGTYVADKDAPRSLAIFASLVGHGDRFHSLKCVLGDAEITKDGWLDLTSTVLTHQSMASARSMAFVGRVVISAACN